jgi:Bacteriophage clamp loader A subunit
MNVFDIMKDLSYDKKGIIDESNEGEYIPFLTNKYFSFFPDTIYYANEMNMAQSLDNKLQHDYYLFSLRKNKRYYKWPKKDNQEIIQAVQKYYGYSVAKAKEVLSILNNEQVELILKRTTPEA